MLNLMSSVDAARLVPTIGTYGVIVTVTEYQYKFYSWNAQTIVSITINSKASYSNFIFDMCNTTT